MDKFKEELALAQRNKEAADAALEAAQGRLDAAHLVGKMTTLKFYGASDDLFCFDRDGKTQEEIGCYNTLAAYLVKDPFSGEGLYIVGVYAFVGDSWALGVQPLDEDIPLPNWGITVGAEGYTGTIKITAPATVSVVPAAPAS